MNEMDGCVKACVLLQWGGQTPNALPKESTVKMTFIQNITLIWRRLRVFTGTDLDYFTCKVFLTIFNIGLFNQEGSWAGPTRQNIHSCFP